MSQKASNTGGSVRYTPSARKPMRFDEVFAGSLFKIVSEPSRRIWKSRDERIYRKAKEHEGFYATVDGSPEIAAVLRPNDLVMPVRKERV